MPDLDVTSQMSNFDIVGIVIMDDEVNVQRRIITVHLCGG